MTAHCTVMAATDNARYVNRGRDLAVSYDPGWEDDLREANRSKEGAPFRYADGLIMAAAALRTVLNMQYRQLSGFLDAMMKGHGSPHFSVLCRRMNRLDVDTGGGLVRVSDRSAPVTLLADSTGLKQCNRGEWIRKKWKVRRGFVKIHLLADANTRRILAVAVSDDRTGDAPVLRDLLGTIAESDDTGQQDEKIPDEKLQDRRMEVIGTNTPASKDPLPPVASLPPNLLAQGISPLAFLCGGQPRTHGAFLLADGAYASRGNMQTCKNMGIRPLIPISTRCNARGKGTGDAWGLAVREQLGGSPETRIDGMGEEEKEENKRYWKSRVGYGRRWLIEIIISAFKRMFGDHVQSRRWEHMVQEIRLRVALYNRWQEAAGM